MIELIDNNQELESYLNLFKDSKNYILTTDGKNVNIKIKSIGLNIGLSGVDLKFLSRGEMIKKSDLSYIKHCGFTYKNYGEICITVFPKRYSFINEAREWDGQPLRFNINKQLFEIGPASPLFVLLNEPIYRDSDWQFDFHNFATIKVINSNDKEIKHEIIKALYYLNSHYLKAINFVAKIYQMNITEDVVDDLWEDNVKEVFKKVNRVRTRTRDDFISIEPLILYNQAQLIKGDEKFLNLYRILEYFMNRARIRKIHEMRFDKNYNDTELIVVAEHKNEEMLLSNLLNESLSSSQKRKISNYVYNRKILKEDNYRLLSRALYNYRNSIVHAKEQQIIDTKIPDLFEQNNDNLPWIYIIDKIAMECIKKYNKTSD